MRQSSHVAFGFAWGVFTLTVFLAWRKVLAVPDGRGDIRRLLVATARGRSVSLSSVSGCRTASEIVEATPPTVNDVKRRQRPRLHGSGSGPRPRQ